MVAGVGAEDDPEVVETLLDQARTAAHRWAPEGTDVLARLHAHCCAALAADPPGSDLQLVHLRAAADTAVEPDEVARWLAGEVPDGVALDAELRWHLLTRLAALGGADADQVQAELDRDRTAAGEQHAARALAARPDPAAKRAVWDELLGDGELSNGRARALASGFWQHGQDDLLRPYVARWAQEVPGLLERRSPQMATVVARLLWPATLVEPATLEVTALDPQSLAPELRRVLLEARDELERALRARTSSDTRRCRVAAD